MVDLLQKALKAKRESRRVEFKGGFNPDSAGHWCEITKDIIAIANSGGGVILFGVDSVGTPTECDLGRLAKVDPSDVTNKILKYTGSVDLEFEIREVSKGKCQLIAFLIHAVSIPIVFEKPGTYDIGGGKQKTAFSVGTVYFRHGAKSEPGCSEDIRKVIECQLDNIRQSWLKGVKKVVQAPAGSQIVTVMSPLRGKGGNLSGTTVRAVKDSTAIPVLLTRDRGKASGTFVHEEVSEGIFDEINNIIDANAALAKGQREFFFGQAVYYRVYAERHHVQQSEDNLVLLFQSAATSFYAPGLFWALHLPPARVAESLANLYLYPKSPHIHFLLRTAVLIGKDFSQWLFDRWHAKWKRDPQPPTFFWSFKNMLSRIDTDDLRVLAARASASGQMYVDNEASVPVSELLGKSSVAANHLSRLCMMVFQGKSQMRTACRDLDFLAYGQEVTKLGPQIMRAFIKAVGDRDAGNLEDTGKSDS